MLFFALSCFKKNIWRLFLGGFWCSLTVVFTYKTKFYVKCFFLACFLLLLHFHWEVLALLLPLILLVTPKPPTEVESSAQDYHRFVSRGQSGPGALGAVGKPELRNAGCIGLVVCCLEFVLFQDGLEARRMFWPALGGVLFGYFVHRCLHFFQMKQGIVLVDSDSFHVFAKGVPFAFVWRGLVIQEVVAYPVYFPFIPFGKDMIPISICFEKARNCQQKR